MQAEILKKVVLSWYMKATSGYAAFLKRPAVLVCCQDLKNKKTFLKEEHKYV